MNSSHEVTWKRLTVDLPTSGPWRNVQPSGTVELTCTCGWSKQVADTEAEVQRATDDHKVRPND